MINNRGCKKRVFTASVRVWGKKIQNNKRDPATAFVALQRAYKTQSVLFTTAYVGTSRGPVCL